MTTLASLLIVSLLVLAGVVTWLDYEIAQVERDRGHWRVER